MTLFYCNLNSFCNMQSIKWHCTVHALINMFHYGFKHESKLVLHLQCYLSHIHQIWHLISSGYKGAHWRLQSAAATLTAHHLLPLSSPSSLQHHRVWSLLRQPTLMLPIPLFAHLMAFALQYYSSANREHWPAMCCVFTSMMCSLSCWPPHFNIIEFCLISSLIAFSWNEKYCLTVNGMSSMCNFNVDMPNRCKAISLIHQVVPGGKVAYE